MTAFSEVLGLIMNLCIMVMSFCWGLFKEHVVEAKSKSKQFEGRNVAHCIC